jgi:hypothetical protein
MFYLKLAAMAALAIGCTPVVHVHMYEIKTAEVTTMTTGVGYAYPRRLIHANAYAVYGVPYNNIVAEASCARPYRRLLLAR